MRFLPYWNLRIQRGHTSVIIPIMFVFFFKLFISSYVGFLIVYKRKHQSFDESSSSRGLCDGQPYNHAWCLSYQGHTFIRIFSSFSLSLSFCFKSFISSYAGWENTSRLMNPRAFFAAACVCRVFRHEGVSRNNCWLVATAWAFVTASAAATPGVYPTHIRNRVS